MRFVSLLLIVTLTIAAPARAESILRIGLRAVPPEHGNPSSALGLPAQLVLQAIYDGLTVIGPQGEAEPALATSWRRENPQTWVFALREGVSFSNGEPFDAKAVVATIDTLLSPEGRTGAAGSALVRWDVKQATARDDHTVVLTTGEPDAILPHHLAAIRIPAPGAWAKLSRADFQQAPVGTGPFKVTRWQEAKVELAANPRAWRAPKVDGLLLQIMPDQSARSQALTSGAVDIAMEIAPEEREALDRLGGQLVVSLKPEMDYLAFVTTKDSPLKDVRVRRALNHAVNKQRIIDAFLGGATTPASQIAHPQAVGYDPTLAPYPYDPERARALLKDAGVAGGFSLPTLLAGGANNLDVIYQQVAIDLAAVGVVMEIRGTTPARQTEYLYQGGWPALAFAMTFTGFDALQAYRTRSCAWTHPYFCDPAMMPLIAAAQQATEPEERQRLTRIAVVHERDNPPGILLWQMPTFDGIGARVMGYHIRGGQVSLAEIALKP